MKEVYFATKNNGKVNSISTSLKPFDIKIIQVPLELPEPRSDDVKTIAHEKILFAYEHIKKPCIALDAGFYINSLNGFPKAFVNFALETIGIEGILRLVEGKVRDCEFRNCLAYLDSSLTKPAYFESSVKGRLAKKPIGELRDNHWSHLSLIFIPQDSEKTLTEMTSEEYQHWRQHRAGNYFSSQFAEWFSKR